MFMPACAYGGNREWTGIPLGEPAYPPGPSPEGFGPEPRLEMTETVPALAPDGRMIFHASCWCGTSLLATWADVVGEPEVARALSAR